MCAVECGSVELVTLLLSAGADVNELLLEESNDDLVVGLKVEAALNNHWLPGVINRVRLNGTYDVDFDNGESSRGLDRDSIHCSAVRFCLMGLFNVS